MTASEDRFLAKRLVEVLALYPDLPYGLLDELQAELARAPNPQVSILSQEAAAA